MPGFSGLTALSSSSSSDTPIPDQGRRLLLALLNPQAERGQSLGNTQEQATAGTLFFMPEVGGGALALLLVGFRMSL